MNTTHQQTTAYNPNAWRDHSLPPTKPHAYRSWLCHDNPIDALDSYGYKAMRMQGVLAKLVGNLREIRGDRAMPFIELTPSDVAGLSELLDAVGEKINLAMNAAESAIATLQEEREEALNKLAVLEQTIAGGAK
ncbi:hypothetical protein [Candidatus Magnetaquicoccus inordinatus]|uniref:hypothetical protein n=1 Tax=Candidatus Magnetaquicoccus inordinatus TaxID=2496818 RepID=UPI00102C7B91|nr:hypothetical protein [Candidatus Magnetaquicoccus inordinatus]